MMKSIETVKNLDVVAVDAVRDLLGHVLNLEIGSVGRDYPIDLRIALSREGVNYALIIEVKTEWGTALCPFRYLPA